MRWLWSRIFGVAGIQGAQKGDFEAQVRLVAQLADQPGDVTSLVLRPRRSWTRTGVVLQERESVTLLTRGDLWLAKSLGIGVGATQALWWRIDEGPAHSMGARTDVLVAPSAGELQLLVAEPGKVSESGDLDPAVRSLPLRGEIEVVVVEWQCDHAVALEAAARVDPDLFGPVHLRTQHPIEAPPGWSYHPRIGEGDLFWQPAADGPISCLSQANVGILRRPVDIEVTDDLVLTWSWWVAGLPSRIAEDLEATHDYFAVALEFDDGRDLSWMWSAALDEGMTFQCPLAYWNDLETHIVVRSGPADLGRWVAERHEVGSDARRHLPSPLPRRATAVWLVANTAIQGGTAAFHVRDVHLTSASQRRHIELCRTSERSPA